MSTIWEREKYFYVDQNLVKKSCATAVGGGAYTMAATLANFAGGDFGYVAALSTRTTIAEVSAGYRFPRSL